MTSDKRVKRFNVRLSNDMAGRLERLAAERGLAPSTMITAIVGEAVALNELQKAKVTELMSDPEFVKQVQFGVENQPSLLDT